MRSNARGRRKRAAPRHARRRFDACCTLVIRLRPATDQPSIRIGSGGRLRGATPWGRTSPAFGSACRHERRGILTEARGCATVLNPKRARAALGRAASEWWGLGRDRGRELAAVSGRVGEESRRKPGEIAAMTPCEREFVRGKQETPRGARRCGRENWGAPTRGAAGGSVAFSGSPMRRSPLRRAASPTALAFFGAGPPSSQSAA